MPAMRGTCKDFAVSTEKMRLRASLLLADQRARCDKLPDSNDRSPVSFAIPNRKLLPPKQTAL